jgi:hypothetical protein
VEWTTAEACEALGIAERTLFRIAKECDCKRERGKYDAPTLIKQHVKREIEKAHGERAGGIDVSEELQREKMEHEKLKKEFTRFKLAKEKGELLDREWVERQEERRVQAVRLKFMALPRQMEGEVGLDREQLIKRLAAAIEEICNEFADEGQSGA